MSRPYQKEIDHLETLLEKGIHATAERWIKYLIKHPNEIKFKLLTGTRDGQEKEWDAKSSSIIRAWRSQPFIRFLDRDIRNCSPFNLTIVPSISDVLVKHWYDAGDWAVDWDCDLSLSEIQLVLNPEWREGLSFA